MSIPTRRPTTSASTGRLTLHAEAPEALGRMSMRLAIQAALLVAVLGCAHQTSTPLDLTRASEAELRRHVGQRVTLRGPFSLLGKVGPFILIRDRPVYLVSHGAFSWGERFERMEGHDVSVTGTLRFAHHPGASQGGRPVARPVDHFYFEAASASIELSQR